MAPGGGQRATWLSAPIAAGLLALLAYNKARFDSWFEIGIKYQLNVFPFVTSKAYLPLNIFSYLFRPVGLACRFPFVSALYDIGARGFPHGVHFPPGYSTHEPQAGLFVTAPWTWLCLVALFFVGPGDRPLAAGRGRPAPPSTASWPTSGARRGLVRRQLCGLGVADAAAVHHGVRDDDALRGRLQRRGWCSWGSGAAGRCWPRCAVAGHAAG